MSQHTYHAEDILLFLEQNPHFFEQNSHLLTHLKWPSSEQEGVIHFTEHKAELLQRENKQLKEQLQTIIHNAQRSENIRQRLHQWACKLIMNRTWAKQPDKMANELKKLFALDEVQIILEDNL